jgi:mannose-6-phosphate isomerase
MKRELHTEEALDAIDFKKTIDCKTAYDEEKNRTAMLVKSPYFITRLINADKPVLKNISELDSFVIYMAVEGQFTLKYEEGEIGMKLGETLIVPASLGNIVIHPDKSSKILEIFMDVTVI